MTLKLALAFAEAGFAIVPVNVFYRGGRWRKRPYVSWRGETSQATTDAKQINEWWDRWPLAMVGVPLLEHVVVDCDRHGGPDGVELFRALERECGPFPPHPHNPTKSNGQHRWFRQPAQPIRYAKWAGGEVLGIGRLVIGYAVPQGPIPELPEVFWPELRREPSIPVGDDRVRDPVLVADLTAALRQMNVLDWNGTDVEGGRHKEWFELLMACKFVGIALDDFVEWSTSDPDYADHGTIIATKWHSIEPRHGGAFWREVNARGIKVRHEGQQHTHARPPYTAKTIYWLPRINSVLNKLAAKQDGDMLFWAGCRVAETMADTGKPKLSVAVNLLVSAVNPVIKRDEALRVITNAFRTVEKQIIEGDAA
jgi:hypothetical protein